MQMICSVEYWKEFASGATFRLSATNLHGAIGQECLFGVRKSALVHVHALQHMLLRC